jgi:hypothetical protein
VRTRSWDFRVGRYCYGLHLLAKKTRDKKEGPLKRRWCNNKARFGKDTAEMENDKVVA